MSHAHHFLSRLDRLSTPHVEFALSLYRDHELLAFILDKARVPEAAPRVAISLATSETERGPFLVVTRDGKFVTCLGEDMSPGDLYIVPRQRLDDIATNYQVLKQRMIESAQRAGRHGGLGKLLGRVHEAGHRLSREDFRAIATWQPLLARDFLVWHIDASLDLQTSTEIFMRDLRRTNKLDKLFDEALRVHYETQWSLAHVTVLAAYGGRVTFDALPVEVLKMFAKYTLSYPCVRQHIYPIAIRGLWAAARVGKPFLPHYKASIMTATTLGRYGNASAGLATIAMRHRRLRAEALKALNAIPEHLSEQRNALRRTAIEVMESHEKNPEEVLAALTKRGVAEAMRLAPLAPKGSPYRFERPEDVPRDLALCIYANRLLDFLRDPAGIALLYDILPWLATIDAEDLYLPADYLSAVRLSWSTAQTNALFVIERDWVAQSKPMAHVTEGPTRNGPCPCGSGKKYKRCCGEGKK